MIRIAICDDELEARENLRFQLEKIINEKQEEIVYEFSGGGSAVRWLGSHPGEIDLLFLDVEMSDLNGMETARRIREFNRELKIVFVTGYRDYVFDGYKVGALDYVMKPAETKRLRGILDRAAELLSQESSRMFSFKNSDGTYRLPFSEIAFFYSDRRLVTVVTEKKEYTFYGKLDEVERRTEEFVRIHQRYLVNPDKVDYVGHDEVHVAGKCLPVSRGMKEQAMSQLARNMLGGGF